MRINLVVFVVAFMAFFACIHANPEKFVKIFGECKEKIKPSEEDLVNLMKKMPPQTKAQKCLMNCVFEGLGFMNGGKLSKEGVMLAANEIFAGDSVKIGKTEEIFTVCSAITDADPCEATAMICDCLMKEGMSRGIQLPFDM